MKFSLIKNDIFSKKNLFNIFLWMNANILDQDIKTTTWTYSSITKILLLSEIRWRPTCLSGDPSETNMPVWRPASLIGDPLDRHVGIQSGMLVLYEACRSTMSHVRLWWGMSVSDEEWRFPIRHVGLQWISGGPGPR